MFIWRGFLRETEVAVEDRGCGAGVRGVRRRMSTSCREANGGVAVVAAGAAMNRNGGHHAEVEHP